MQFHENINRDIIAVAGTWDPMLPRHIALFKELIRYSRKKSLNPYIIIFYPNPVNHLLQNRHSEYFDLDARMAYFKRLALNSVVVADLTKEDLKRPVADFFDELFKSTGVVLNELWAGENQSLGGGPQGFGSLVKECSARNIKLRKLKNSFLVNLDKEAIYKHIKAGEFEAIAAMTGYYPTYKFKEDRRINMHDGVYSAKLRTTPFDSSNEAPVVVKIVDGCLQEIKKPVEYNWLILSERLDKPIPAEPGQ